MAALSALPSSEEWAPIHSALYEAFAELSLARTRYSARLTQVIESRSEELDHYLPELKSVEMPPGTSLNLELQDIELKREFKCFMISVKATLDRLVQVYDQRYRKTLRKFSKSGLTLLKYLRRDHREDDPSPLILLVSAAKRDWIDAAIELRDEIVHYSDLREFMSLHYLLTVQTKYQIAGTADMHPPVIAIRGTVVRADEYMTRLHSALLGFAHDFVSCCARK